MQHTSESLQWTDIGDGWRRATITLDHGDSAWNPASTKSLIHGPAEVTYTRAPDGGVDAKVEARP